QLPEKVAVGVKRGNNSEGVEITDCQSHEFARSSIPLVLLCPAPARQFSIALAQVKAGIAYNNSQHAHNPPFSRIKTI
ncbi:MAG: hypothetical protein ABFE02_18400, partial [Sulfuricella sp.]